MASFLKLSFVACVALATAPAFAQVEPTPRTSAGLLVLYEFNEGEGATVRDVSGAQPPADMLIADLQAVRRTSESLELVKETQILSATPPQRLIETIRRTGSLTLEAWLTPAATNQEGPARILTLSRNSSIRNFTLGQDGDKYDVRLRTTKTGDNGTPSLGSPSGSLTTELTHVVYTRNRSGQAMIFINGSQAAELKVDGRLSNWNDFRLGLANEQGNGRPWRGSLHLVAVYGRALTPTEITQNYQAGPEGQTSDASGQSRDPRVVQFETRIAPLLSDRCLECHDTATANGGLDLSKKVAALRGGESGKVIVAGSATDSLLWQAVDSDEMPHDRPPLTPEEKQRVAKWIDEGAVWSLDQIDPAVYAHSGGSNDSWIQRLTVAEYIETVRSTTGVDISKQARALLPPDLRADGFSNTAYNLTVDLKHVRAYATLAELIVAQIDVAEFAKRFSKSRKFTDNDMGNLIANMGKWLLRGPLDAHEISLYRGISTSVAASGGDFDEAAGLIIEAMLQSPRFLYRMENQIGSGGRLPANEYELASRMSYILWGGPPDEELMKRADDGSLLDPEVLDQQLVRMLADPRAKRHSQRFVTDWLNLNRLGNLSPNADRFPTWNPRLAEAMRKETLAFFEEVIWHQQRPLSDLLNAQVTFVSEELAKHYGLPSLENASAGESGSTGELQRYDLSERPERGGLLTQGSILTVGGDDASMVTRGLLVMHELLRGVVKDPPPCVDTTPIPTEPGVTQRSIAMGRVLNANCGGCHAKFEPLAFGLERFDGLGTFHERDEHGNELHDDGEILFPGDAKPISFGSSAELMNLLAKSERVKQSLTWKLTQFALGRPLTANDVAEVDRIHQQAQQAGGGYADTLKAIINSELVQFVDTHPPKSPTDR